MSTTTVEFRNWAVFTFDFTFWQKKSSSGSQETTLVLAKIDLRDVQAKDQGLVRRDFLVQEAGMKCPVESMTRTTLF